MKTPISRHVEKFVRTRFGIAECLRQGLINQKALARLICQSTGDSQLSAAQMALSRLARRMTKRESHEHKIAKELKRAKILTRSNMMTVVLRAPLPFGQIAELQKRIFLVDDEFTLIHGTRNVTLILGQEHREVVRSLFGRSNIQILQGLVKIQILLGNSSMEMHGFSAFVCAQISAYGINLVQELTCSGEHLLLIKENDLQMALQALRPTL